MTALAAKAKRAGALLLLPLSVLPFVLIGPGLVDSHRQFKRDQKSRALAAPTVVISPAELGRWKPLPNFTEAVPVVSYENVGRRGARSVTRLQLARHFAMLSRLGYRTISIRQYRRWREGLPAGMPPKPILLTFDGGRLATFRGADRLLQRHGFEATMFVPTAGVSERDHSLLTWKELHEMEDSGRWDVQAEGTHSDAQVAVGATGAMGPAYAFRRYTESGGIETYAEWQQRVTRDLFKARKALVDQGFAPAALAVPGGDYGQNATNDPRIPGYVRGLINSQFGVAFVRGIANYPAYTRRNGPAARYELGRTTTADNLYNWLRAKHPAR